MQRNVTANILRFVPNWLHLTAQYQVLMLFYVLRLAILTPVNKCSVLTLQIMCIDV